MPLFEYAVIRKSADAPLPTTADDMVSDAQAQQELQGAFVVRPTPIVCSDQAVARARAARAIPVGENLDDLEILVRPFAQKGAAMP